MDKVKIFTDGACKGNPGVGGWGALLKFGKKETAKGELPLTFHYDLIYSNDMSGKELQEDLKFKNLLGDILMDIMEKQLEDNSLQYVNSTKH